MVMQAHATSGRLAVAATNSAVALLCAQGNVTIWPIWPWSLNTAAAAGCHTTR